MAKRDELTHDQFMYALKLANDSGHWGGRAEERNRILNILRAEYDSDIAERAIILDLINIIETSIEDEN